MSKLSFLTDMKDYCVCEHLNLGKKQPAKIGLKVDRKLNNKKKVDPKKKYEFPVKKFQQLERFFLSTPKRQIRPQRNRERTKDANKQKKNPVKQHGEQETGQDWYGNKQHHVNKHDNKRFDETEVINCEENRLQMNPVE
ncbi:uncharacterized protein [Halyomorpha halys]|uniref:uncharacterized protein n=1 Tax=Halyomorpha halys TaxID=286706 RepID=UPI0006D50FD0|nr:uncharacterized protein LOC106689442 [Halyomorpha halys]